MMQAVAALRQGRLADARAVLESVLALRDSSEAHRVLGLIYWAGSQHDKSIEQLEIAVQRNPRDERSRLALARVIASTGRDQDAQRMLQDAIQRPPRFGVGAIVAWIGLSSDSIELAEARAGIRTGCVSGDRRPRHTLCVDRSARLGLGRSSRCRRRIHARGRRTSQRSEACAKSSRARCCNRTARRTHSWSWSPLC